LFLYIFRICSLKILTSWKSRGGARAPVPHSWRRQWLWGGPAIEYPALIVMDPRTEHNNLY